MRLTATKQPLLLTVLAVSASLHGSEAKSRLSKRFDAESNAAKDERAGRKAIMERACVGTNTAYAQ